jgi:hypothetical protein
LLCGNIPTDFQSSKALFLSFLVRNVNWKIFCGIGSTDFHNRSTAAHPLCSAKANRPEKEACVLSFKRIHFYIMRIIVRNMEMALVCEAMTISIPTQETIQPFLCTTHRKALSC